MWTKNDLAQIQSDVSVIYASIMKEAITERNGSFIIDLESVVSVPADISENMMLYSAASEIFQMCTAEYRNTVRDTVNGWVNAPTIRHMIAIMNDLQKAVYAEANIDVAEKATMFTLIIMQRNN